MAIDFENNPAGQNRWISVVQLANNKNKMDELAERTNNKSKLKPVDAPLTDRKLIIEKPVEIEPVLEKKDAPNEPEAKAISKTMTNVETVILDEALVASQEINYNFDADSENCENPDGKSVGTPNLMNVQNKVLKKNQREAVYSQKKGIYAEGVVTGLLLTANIQRRQEVMSPRDKFAK